MLDNMFYVPTWKGVFNLISCLDYKSDKDLKAFTIFLSEGKSLNYLGIDRLFESLNVDIDVREWVNSMMEKEFLEIDEKQYFCSDFPLEQGIALGMLNLSENIALVDNDGLILNSNGFEEVELEELLSISADFASVLDRSFKRGQNLLRGKHLFSFNGEDGLPLYSFFKFYVYEQSLWLISKEELMLSHPAFIDFVWYLFYKLKPSQEVLISSLEMSKKALKEEVDKNARVGYSNSSSKEEEKAESTGFKFSLNFFR